MKDSLLREGINLKGKLGRVFKLKQQVSSREGAQRATPTVTYTRLKQHAEVWKAASHVRSLVWRFLNVALKGRALVKASFSLSREMVNEAKALARLQGRFGVLGRRIVPRLYQGITRTRVQTQEGEIRDLWFFATEWLELEGEKKEWVSLRQILDEVGINDTEDLLRLQRALQQALHWMHRRGVVHGDIKDEHIIVKVRNDERGKKSYDFSNIRFVDFGASYLLDHPITGWNGATPGFCPPFFWSEATRHSLDQYDVKWLDRYAVDAVLYRALTGEYFPIASPAYKSLWNQQPETRQRFLKAIIKHLNGRFVFENVDDWPRRALAYWLIQRLSVIEPGDQDFKPFYLPKMMTLSGKEGWAFLEGVLGVALFMLYWTRNVSVEASVLWGVSGLVALLVWRKKREDVFFLKVKEETFWSEKHSWWEELMMLVWWVVGGIILLPGYLFPTLPVIAGLLTRRWIGRFLASTLLIFGSMTTLMWKRQALMTFTGWPITQLLSEAGWVILVLVWLVSYWLTQYRCKVRDYRTQWWSVVAGFLMSWIGPMLLGKSLVGIHPRIFFDSFVFSGVMSLGVILLGGMYATWYFINVDPDVERKY